MLLEFAAAGPWRLLRCPGRKYCRNCPALCEKKFPLSLRGEGRGEGRDRENVESGKRRYTRQSPSPLTLSPEGEGSRTLTNCPARDSAAPRLPSGRAILPPRYCMRPPVACPATAAIKQRCPRYAASNSAVVLASGNKRQSDRGKTQRRWSERTSTSLVPAVSCSRDARWAGARRGPTPPGSPAGDADGQKIDDIAAFIQRAADLGRHAIIMAVERFANVPFHGDEMRGT